MFLIYVIRLCLSSQPFPAVGFLAGRVFDEDFTGAGVFDFRFAGNLAFVIIAGLVVPERGGTEQQSHKH